MRELCFWTMLKRQGYQNLLSLLEADRETCQRVEFLTNAGRCLLFPNLRHLRVRQFVWGWCLFNQFIQVVIERATPGGQSRKTSQNENVRTEGQQLFVRALSAVKDLPEEDKSKLFLTIFRDLSFASKSSLLLDLLQECKDLKAAGQVSFQNIFIIIIIFYNV